MFRCPVHDDSSPSCHFIEDSNGTLIHCFGCGWTGDIFHLASHPQFGALPAGDHPDWFRSTFVVLADLFKIELAMDPLTEDEVYEVNLYRAYEHAANIVATCRDCMDPESLRLYSAIRPRSRIWGGEMKRRKTCWSEPSSRTPG